MNENNNLSQQAIDIAIRMVLLFALLFWCFQIIAPFLMPVLWGIIIAIALDPVQELLQKKFKMSPKWSSILITIILLAIVLVPTIMFFSNTTKTLLALKDKFATEGFVLPEPPQFLLDLPVVGDKIHEFLGSFNSNVEEFVKTHQEKVIEVGKKIMTTLIDAGLGIVHILVSIILAGVFLAIGDQKGVTINLFDKLVGKDGHTYVQLIVQTIRSVVKGVLGVALMQTIFVAIGVFATGIPHGALWVLLCLFLSIVQVGPSLIILGVVAYLFENESATYAGIWTAYFVLTALSDNVIKPFLLGKGAQVPMAVIFIGVVGGFIFSGFIGLFTGAIVLSIAYKLFQFWMNEDQVKQEIFEGGEY